MLVKLARHGRHVVRLKSGDPLIFGRATEEIEACERAGIPVSIVPGVTSAQGAAAALGISLTERHQARRVQFLTGHGADGRLPRDIAWEAVADPTATTILYMPGRTLAAFRDEAIAAGLDPATPALAMRNATRPDAAEVVGTITNLPELLGSLPSEGPVLVMIGKVLRRRGSEADGGALVAAAA